VLGAIVSLPDAVSVTAITRRLKLPATIVTILEGESLVNDATALLAYRMGVAAVVAGAFSFWEAGWRFCAHGHRCCPPMNWILRNSRRCWPGFLTIHALTQST
jgi:hypothetical protein